MVKTMEKEKAQAEGLYQIISDDVDESYFAEQIGRASCRERV